MIYTYFISNSVNSLIKIGRTKDIKQRAKDIRGQLNFVELKVELLLEGDYELPLHRYYKDVRLPGGEWFNLQEIPSEEFIKSVSTEFYDKLEYTFGITRSEISALDIESDLRVSNIDEFEFNSDYIVNWEGFNFIHCRKPFKQTNKYNSLLSYCTNLMCLNKDASRYDITSHMSIINKESFAHPIPEEKINTIVDTVYRQMKEDRLYPIRTSKLRKIIFNPKATYDNNADTRLDKLTVCRNLLADKKVKDSKKKLQNLIDAWDIQLQGKVSIRSLAKQGKMGKNTVAKYYDEFRELINNKNMRKLTPKDKNDIVLDLLAQHKVEVSCNKIKQAVDNWEVEPQGKITIHKLAEHIPMNVKTVKKYYYIFKETVKEKNKKLLSKGVV